MGNCIPKGKNTKQQVRQTTHGRTQRAYIPETNDLRTAGPQSAIETTTDELQKQLAVDGAMLDQQWQRAHVEKQKMLDEITQLGEGDEAAPRIRHLTIKLKQVMGEIKIIEDQQEKQRRLRLLMTQRIANINQARMQAQVFALGRSLVAAAKSELPESTDVLDKDLEEQEKTDEKVSEQISALSDSLEMSSLNAATDADPNHDLDADVEAAINARKKQRANGMLVASATSISSEQQQQQPQRQRFVKRASSSVNIAVADSLPVTTTTTTIATTTAANGRARNRTTTVAQKKVGAQVYEQLADSQQVEDASA